MTTYVVEDPVTGDLTDMFSFREGSSTPQPIADVIAVIVTKSPAKQFIIDLLLCIKQQQFEIVGVFLGAVKKMCLVDDIFHAERDVVHNYHLYNYQYPDIDEGNVCLFGHYH